MPFDESTPNGEMVSVIGTSMTPCYECEHAMNCHEDSYGKCNEPGCTCDFFAEPEYDETEE